MIVFIFGIICFCLGSIWKAPYKFIIQNYYQTEYESLVYKCDNSMREHLVAKNKALKHPSKETILSLQASEIGLYDCHEYDKFRKFLITLGLSENNLAHMALKAIESNDFEISNIVNPHEITF